MRFSGGGWTGCWVKVGGSLQWSNLCKCLLISIDTSKTKVDTNSLSQCSAPPKFFTTLVDFSVSNWLLGLIPTTQNSCDWPIPLLPNTSLSLGSKAQNVWTMTTANIWKGETSLFSGNWIYLVNSGSNTGETRGSFREKSGSKLGVMRLQIRVSKQTLTQAVTPKLKVALT